MPSSSDTASSTFGYDEVIRSRDNSRETLYVASAVFIILLLAAFLLWATHQSRIEHQKLPVAINSVVTQLSNARIEIDVLQEMEQLPSRPTLRALIEAELAPFHEGGFEEHGPGCFIHHVAVYILRFRHNPSAAHTWQIDWLDERKVSQLDHAAHAGGSNDWYCDDHIVWHSVSTNSLD